MNASRSYKSIPVWKLFLDEVNFQTKQSLLLNAWYTGKKLQLKPCIWNLNAGLLRCNFSPLFQLQLFGGFCIFSFSNSLIQSIGLTDSKNAVDLIRVI